MRVRAAYVCMYVGVWGNVWDVMSAHVHAYVNLKHAAHIDIHVYIWIHIHMFIYIYTYIYVLNPKLEHLPPKA